jgi:type I restriction enzyme, S subunit
MTRGEVLKEIAEFNPSRQIRKGTLAPFVDMAALPTNGRDVSTIAQREYQGGGSKFKNGDILFARITPCLENGKTAKMSGLKSGEVAHGSTEFIVISAKEPEYDEDFIYYLARLPEFRAYAEKRMEGTSGRQRVSWQSVEAFSLELPDKYTRSEIGMVLSSIDDKIELNQRMNETLEGMARALFKSWFVDFDPVRAKAEGRKPEGMDSATAALFPAAFNDDGVPKGWKQGTLGMIADNAGTTVQPSQTSPDTPYIGLEHMPRRCIALSEWAGAGKVTSNKFSFKRGDFLFGKLRPYFHKVGIAAIDGISSTDILIVRPKREEFYSFTLSVISSDEFVGYTDQTSRGTKMPRTNWKDMARYEIVLPDNRIAAAYNASVKPMLERVMMNIHESRTLSSLRDTLLPKLISGDIRIGEEEKIRETV